MDSIGFVTGVSFVVTTGKAKQSNAFVGTSGLLLRIAPCNHET
jgi:hypothetical protein